MEILTNEPAGTFFAAATKGTVKSLKLAFPFITEPVVENIIEPIFKKKKTTIELVTNLSSFNVAISLSNPCTPLLTLIDLFQDRITIRSHSNLHAKVIVVDNRKALFGSSNMTSGGEWTNKEMNAMFTGYSAAEQAHVEEIVRWFREVFNTAIPMNRDALIGIGESWENSNQRKAFLSAVLPEARLGGDYWQKVQRMAKEPTMALEDAKELLAKDGGAEDSATPKNFEPKLRFLQETGIVSHWDEHRITMHPDAQRITASPDSFYSKLRETLPAVVSVLREIRAGGTRTTYKDLHARLLGTVTENEIHVAAKWLVSLGFVELEKVAATYNFLPGKPS